MLAVGVILAKGSLLGLDAVCPPIVIVPSVCFGNGLLEIGGAEAMPGRGLIGVVLVIAGGGLGIPGVI